MRQLNSPSHAVPAPLDRSTPATFYADVHHVETLSKPTMAAIAFHEGLPVNYFYDFHLICKQGHLFERTVVARSSAHMFNKNVPFLLTAYLEGWALYAGKVAVSF